MHGVVCGDRRHTSRRPEASTDASLWWGVAQSLGRWMFVGEVPTHHWKTGDPLSFYLSGRWRPRLWRFPVHHHNRSQFCELTFDTEMVKLIRLSQSKCRSCFEGSDETLLRVVYGNGEVVRNPRICLKIFRSPGLSPPSHKEVSTVKSRLMSWTRQLLTFGCHTVI